MKLFIKLAAAAAVSMAIAGQANAGVLDSGGVNPELAVYVYDGAKSVVVDLNVLLSANSPGTITTQNFGLDLSGFDLANTRYGVVAADLVTGSGRIATTLDATLYNQFLAENTGGDPSPLGSQFQTSALFFNNYVSGIFNDPTQCAGGPVCAGTNGTFKYYGTGDYNLSLPFPASNLSSDTLDFYLASTTGGDTASVAHYSGHWSLALNGANSILTYTAAGAPVPLPAGVWLLISGLTSLGAVARRRKAQNVAA